MAQPICWVMTIMLFRVVQHHRFSLSTFQSSYLIPIPSLKWSQPETKVWTLFELINFKVVGKKSKNHMSDQLNFWQVYDLPA